MTRVGAFRLALGCLTVLPWGPRRPVEARLVGTALPYFPIVGALIGLILLGSYRALAPIAPPLVTAACLLIIWVLLTGALHLDGLGDYSDALGVGRSAAQRLRVMKDPHIGAFGVVSICLVLFAKGALLASVPWATFPAALVVIPSLARYVMTLLMTTCPSARAGGGAAGPFITSISRGTLPAATAVTALISVGLLGLPGVTLLGVTVIVGLILRMLFVSQLGGVTGDALGAAGEVLETALLFVTPYILTWT